MQILKNEDLNLRKIMVSMGIIMLVWAVFLYPFDYFVFPKDMTAEMKVFIGITREFIRMLPAIYFFVRYKDSLSVSLAELFSFKFDYKVFSLISVLILLYVMGASYLKNGNLHFDQSKMGIYDILFWLSLGTCQEFVFRGWSFNAFSKVVSKKNAVILSSIFFAVSHWFAYFWRLGMFGVFDFGEFIRTTIFTFIFGVGMCLIPLKTESKSIIPCIFLHFLWDFLAFCY